MREESGLSFGYLVRRGLGVVEKEVTKAIARGINKGRHAGLAEGRKAGLAEGRHAGYEEGWKVGHKDGHAAGYRVGVNHAEGKYKLAYTCYVCRSAIAVESGQADAAAAIAAIEGKWGHGECIAREACWASFVRMLKARGRARLTIKVYSEAARQFEAFCAARGWDSAPAAVERHQVEAFVLDQLERHSPGTACNRFRALNTFFRWLVTEEELAVNPMAKMHPPTVTVQPPEVLSLEDVRKLLKTCSGRTFADRRDTALITVLFTSTRLSGRTSKQRTSPRSMTTRHRAPHSSPKSPPERTSAPTGTL